MNVPVACGDCPLASSAKGFALSSGALPPKSGICILLETPDINDCAFRVKDLVDGYAETQRRVAAYPTLEDRWIRLGAPATSWDDKITTMWNWILTPMGLQRSDVALFFTLNCFPGRGEGKKLLYPKGDIRKKAEATCAGLWLKPLVEWGPTMVVVGIEVASRSDSTPVPIALRCVEKAKRFAAAGERVLLVIGNRAAKHWLSYAENSTRWAGHWQIETPWTRQRRQERWDENRRLSVVKVKREKKLTLKQEVIRLLSGIPEDADGSAIYVTPLDVARLRALCETKKKVKGEVAA